MKSKIFYIGLMVLLLVGYLYPAQVTKANGLEEDQEDKIEEPLVISATDRENLKSLGFTDEEIDNISSEEYALNNGLKGEIIDSYTKYYKVYESTDEANKVAGENKVQAFSYDNLSGEVEITAEQYYNELEQLSLADENKT